MKTLFLQWLDERTGFPTLCRKLQNVTVPTNGGILRFLPTMILFAFALQGITGVLLWTFYSPSPLSAWESLFYLQFFLPGGWMVRGVHHFSAQLLVVLLTVYLLGQVFSGRYRAPREFVFWTAFLLFSCSLAAMLTGDLLGGSISGVSATLHQGRLLQMLPGLGSFLFRILFGGSELGTLTFSRFLVLHILVFGSGFGILAILWRFFDHHSETADDTPRRPFWSDEVLRHSLACLLVMAVLLILVWRTPLLHALRPDWFPMSTHLPVEASLGVHPEAPASVFLDTARPPWTFRALDHFSNFKRADGAEIFPGERKYFPIFVVPAVLLLYALWLPLLVRWKIGHVFNIFVVLLLFLSTVYLTFASCRLDGFDSEFRENRDRSERLASRAVELGLSPEGIPPSGIQTLLRHDPFLQGPVLFEHHCASCHPFQPLKGDREHPDFRPIPGDGGRAPNLYEPIRRERIAGFLSSRRFQSDDYFGRTKFFPDGRMIVYLRDRMKDILRESEANEELLDELVTFLYEEAQRDGSHRVTPLDLSRERLLPLQIFECGRCHLTDLSSSKPSVSAPDLRGYLSRDWMIGMIADPESARFYGPPIGRNQGNDAMPAFHRSAGEAVMTLHEIEILVDWLRGRWYRFEKAERQPVRNVTPGLTSGAQ